MPSFVMRDSSKHPQQRSTANWKRQDERFSKVARTDSWQMCLGDMRRWYGVRRTRTKLLCRHTDGEKEKGQNVKDKIQ